MDGLVYLTTRFSFSNLKITGGGNLGLKFQQWLLLLNSLHSNFSTKNLKKLSQDPYLRTMVQAFAQMKGMSVMANNGPTYQDNLDLLQIFEQNLLSSFQ